MPTGRECAAERRFWKLLRYTLAKEGKVKDKLIALQEDVIPASRTLGEGEK